MATKEERFKETMHMQLALLLDGYQAQRGFTAYITTLQTLALTQVKADFLKKQLMGEHD
jgi:hypothetical protein